MNPPFNNLYLRGIIKKKITSDTIFHLFITLTDKKRTVNSNHLNTLKRMDQLIRTKSTGNPADFAGRLSLSERSIYNYLSLLREMGAPVKYSRAEESYIYDDEGQFVIGFKYPAIKNYAF